MKASKTPVEDRYVHIRKYLQLALVAIMLCCVMMFAYQSKLRDNETAAINNAEHQANITTNSDICKSFPQEPLCVLAKEISENPTKSVAGPVGPQGLTGPKGDRGLGVQEFTTNDKGRLIVTYSDGTTKDLGEVQGAPGAQGATGPAGIQGLAGRGISQTGVQNGQLVVTYTDGTVEAIGNIVGPKGETGSAGESGAVGAAGPPGPAGAVGPVGPAGPAGDVGAVGPKGDTGETGATGQTGAEGRSVRDITTDTAGTVTVTYSDGTTATAGQITLTTVSRFECVNNILYIQLSSEETIHSTEVQCVSAPPAPVEPETTP